METGKTGSAGINTEKAVISRGQKAVNTELMWHSDDAKYRKLLIQSLCGILMMPSTESCLILQKLNKYRMLLKKRERQNSNSEQRIAKRCPWIKKNPSNGLSTSLPKSEKDTIKGTCVLRPNKKGCTMPPDQQ